MDSPGAETLSLRRRPLFNPMLATLNDLRLADLKHVPDPNGTLAVVEVPRDVPFDVKRLFYVYGVKAGDVRGEHAHRRAHQYLICVRGRCEITCDDGSGRRSYLLDSPTKALLIPPGIWAEQKYQIPATILLVLSDRPYEEDDYIRDHDRFLAFRGPAASKK